MSNGTYNSIAFDALAEGVFSNASSATDVKAGLIKAYDLYSWDNPDEVAASLEKYSEMADHLYKDQTAIPNIGEAAPISFEDIVQRSYTEETDEDGNKVKVSNIEGDIDLYNRWEKENLEYIATSKAPEVLVNKRKFKDGVQEYAKQKRTETYQEAKRQRGPIGQFLTNIGESAANISAAVLKPLESTVNIFTDDFELTQSLTEIVDPEYANSWTGKIEAGIAQGASSVALAATAGPAALIGYQGAGATGEVVQRYQDTLEKTGDKGEARAAAGIEATSQGLQLLGERLGFGKAGEALTKGIKKELPKAIASNALIEGSTEAAGQAISNVAENIETARPMAENVGRGVVEAGVIGGIAGAAVGGVVQAQANQQAANKVELNEQNTAPGTNPSTSRADELAEIGTPITPIEKQVIGPVASRPANLTEDIVDYDIKATDEGEINVASKVAPKYKSEYELEDGSNMARTEDGRLIRSKPDGTIEEAFDDYIYTDENTAQEIVLATATGKAKLGFDAEENPVLLSTDGNNTVLKKIPATTEGTAGQQIIGISNKVSPNKQENVTHIYPLPPKIKNVVIDRSLGAAGEQTQEMELTQFGKKMAQRLEEDPESMSPIMQQLASKGFYKTTISREEINRELERFGDFFGLTDWLLSTPDNSVTELEAAGATAAFNQLDETSKQATASEDPDTFEKIIDVADPLLTKVDRKGTISGRALKFTDGKTLPKIASTMKAYRNTKSAAIAEEVILEQDLSFDEINKPELIANQIQVQKNIFETTQRAADLPDAQEQEVYEEELSALEAEGQLEADTVNKEIETEIQTLEQEVIKTEKKAEKRKTKDLAVLEEKVLKDTEQLLEITADAQDIKDLTSEEIAKIEVQKQEQLKAAEDAAASELKTLVADTRRQAKEKKDVVKKTLEQKFNEAKARADKISADAQESITKLKLKQNAADDAGKAVLEQKIEQVKEKVVKARTRQAEIKEALDQQLSEPEIDAETETILQQLNEGIVVSQDVVGKKRKISIRTKSGLDLGSLFNKLAKTGSGTAGLLGGLNSTVNNLASAFKTTGKLKESANSQIKQLESIINKNKAVLEQARKAPATSASEQKKIDAARKRLESLKKIPAATAETALPAAKRRKLDTYKQRLAAVKNRRQEKAKSPVNAERLKKIQELERKQKRAEAANKRAKQKAIKAAKLEQDNQDQIEILERAINALPEGGTKREKLAQLAARKAASTGTAIPMQQLLDGMFVNNLIGNGTNLGPAAGNLAVWAPIRGGALALIDGYNKIKSLATGKDYRSTFLPYLSELFNKANLKSGASLAKAALAGERVGAPIEMSDLAVVRRLKFLQADNTDLLNNLQTSQETDWKKFTESINYEAIDKNKSFSEKLGSSLKNKYLALVKASGQFAGPLVRLITTIEAFSASNLTSAFQAASSAYYYNKKLDSFKGEATPAQLQELQEFKYNSAENRAKAKASAQNFANSLKAAGVELSPARQRVLEEEIFQSLPSRQVMIDAIKQVGLVNLNTPAQGFTGVVTQSVTAFITMAQGLGPIGRSLKYLVPFANSIGNMAGMAIELTPLGAGVKIFQDEQRFNRTSFEKDLAMATSILGASITGAVLSALVGQLEVPEEERFFDIIGNKYSKSPSKVQAFKNNGGLTNSIRVGNTYVPFPETSLSLIFGALGAFADRKREGLYKDDGTEESMLGALVWSGFDAADSLTRISMVKGLTDIYEAIQRGKQDPEGAGVGIGRTLINITKPMLIPGLGALRTISKYTDNPVEGWKDIKSSIVEGLPFVQSAAGMPALNMFGEPIKGLGDKLGSGLHRIYSTRAQDLDIRWLVDRQYSVPHINNIKLDTDEKEMAASYKPGINLNDLEYPARRAILKEAGPQMREIVGRYRDTYGYSARSDDVQKDITKEMTRALAEAKLKYVMGELSEDE